MDKIRDFWEDRSRKYGYSIEGVLDRSLPRPLNKYLDDWMYSKIESVIPKGKKAVLLDLGCGYGRMSQRILENYPLVRAVGVDISPHYVDLYNKKLSPRGRAICNSIEKVNFKKNSVDVAIIIVTLMYFKNENRRKKVLAAMFKAVKTRGKFVIIEPTKMYIFYIYLRKFIGLFRRGNRTSQVDPKLFSPKEIVNFFSKRAAF